MLSLVVTAVLLPIADQLSDLRHVRGEHRQTAKNEEHHEETAECCRAVDVTIAHCGHGDHKEVDALPVCDAVHILEVGERIARVLQLQRRRLYYTLNSILQKSQNEITVQKASCWEKRAKSERKRCSNHPCSSLVKLHIKSNRYARLDGAAELAWTKGILVRSFACCLCQFCSVSPSKKANVVRSFGKFNLV